MRSSASLSLSVHHQKYSLKLIHLISRKIGLQGALVFISFLPLLAHAQNSLSDVVGIPPDAAIYPIPGVGFVNLRNGNLHMEMPIRVVKDRNGAPLTTNLVYDNSVWQQIQVPGPNQIQCRAGLHRPLRRNPRDSALCRFLLPPTIKARPSIKRNKWLVAIRKSLNIQTGSTLTGTIPCIRFLHP